MHPTITHQVSLQNQRRILDRAAADRLARAATVGRPSPIARLIAGLRRGTRPVARHPEPRPATSGQA